MDWSTTQVYNTIMAVSAGVSLVLLARFFNGLLKESLESIEGWILGFAVPAIILTITGVHMTLTWPIAKLGLPFDDIIFGESSFAFGILLLVFTAFLWHKYKLALKAQNLNTKEFFTQLKTELPKTLTPLSLFIGAMGLGLIMMAIAGVKYQLFAAPAQEPISGMFADYPLVEALFVSSLYFLVGFGAVVFGFFLKNQALFVWVRCSWTISGVILALFGIMNYFTHIGLIVNTMGH